MTQDHPSKLSFSIEESVWLNKGQEVAEILSMSLDPEIRIEEKNDHVVIKGGLRLLGEYRPVQNDAENTEEGEVAAFRSFEEVTLNDQNIGEIKHFFPIDVTIPLSRIQNIDDVYVQVETFDYDLPEKSCLQLTADVAISGMSTQQQEVNRPSYAQEPSYSEPSYEQEPSYSEQPSYSDTAYEREERPSYYTDATSNVEQPSIPHDPSFSEELPEMEKPPSLQPFPSFSFEARKQAIPEPKAEAEEPVVEAKELVPAMEEPEYEQQYETPKFEVEGSEPIQNQEPVIPKHTPGLNFEARPDVIEPEEGNPIDNLVPNNQRSSEQAAHLNQETTEQEERPIEEVEQEEALEAGLQAAEAPAGREEEETKINFAPLKKLSERPPTAVEELEDEAAVENQDEPAAEAVKVPKSRTDENALYLTKMLADGEEQFSKLKMCIIQENESLDTIAERYELSTSQIIRVNRLNEERVEEGQILYIPVGSKR
ncbi:stage VI sporulation protein D [Alkalihalobacterium chitinilyticum]|uniref:Stage VI sporulation protein D n=1 Tax=Alkalihalobacterium chitinilyticum TaxID=2980103 RepID=A0ABT5VD55_9BACI|nr:stage VI sporulation protein D [Alkalihalobacterium chitinilyticum]MDE5412423.1 stage VI sporulation protein D [Alkalihalobacterium chitinilyticum]